MIRQAKKEDVNEVISILDIVLDEMELPILEKVSWGQLNKVLKKGFLTEDYRYSYHNAIVEERDGKVVGIAYGFPADKEAHIDDRMGEFMPEIGLTPEDKIFTVIESYPGEWYLETLSVAEDSQHQGVGTAILKALPQMLKDRGETKLGLNVDVDNPNAQSLYKKIGFKKVGELWIGKHLYDHMQLDLEQLPNQQ